MSQRFQTEITRHWLTTAALLGRGFEGEVWGVREDRELAIKIPVGGHPLSDREAARLRALIGLGLPEQPTVDPKLWCAWPRELIVNGQGRPAGFVMRRAPGEPMKLASLMSIRGREQAAVNLSYKTVTEIAVGVARMVSTLHANGLILCDLNDRGVLLLEGGRMLLTDLDSVQFVDRTGTGYLSPLFSPEYLAPELDPTRLNSAPRTVEHDRYSHTYLQFRILMVGFGPFDGRRADGKPNDLASQSRDGWYAYGDQVKEITPPRNAPPPQAFSSEVARLFERTFTAGGHEPVRRADAEELLVALQRQAESLVPCDGLRTHMHLGPGDCVWCEWEQRVGLSSKRQRRGKMKVARPAQRAPATGPARSPLPLPTPRPQRVPAPTPGRVRAGGAPGGARMRPPAAAPQALLLPPEARAWLCQRRWPFAHRLAALAWPAWMNDDRRRFAAYLTATLALLWVLISLAGCASLPADPPPLNPQPPR